jgi:flagellar hook-associated protein 2
LATSSVSGGSIDVSTLVSQLMAVERQPLQRLQTRESQVQSRLSAYGRVQGALSALQTAVAALARPASFTGTKATVSGSGVAAAVTGAAPAGSYAVSVERLARAQSTVSAQRASSSAAIGSGDITLRKADGSVLATVNIGAGGTLAEARDKINAAQSTVRASIIGDGTQVRLVLNGTATGQANGFSIELGAGLQDLGFTTPQAAVDARFSVNGLALTSASNVVSNAIDGVSLSLTQAPAASAAPGSTVDATVTLDTDVDQMVKSVNAFISAYNDVDKLITDLSKYDPTTRTGAVLNGESALRQIQTQLRTVLRGVVSGATGDYTQLSQVGIGVQRSGALGMDEAKLRAAATADPAKLARLFATDDADAARDGLAVRMQDAVRSLLNSNGVLDSRQQGLQASIRTLDQQQERMQARLDLIEARLKRQYSDLDALLTSRQGQSNALANALAGLPSLK